MPNDADTGFDHLHFSVAPELRDESRSSSLRADESLVSPPSPAAAPSTFIDRLKQKIRKLKKDDPWCCQFNAHWSPIFQPPASSCRQLAPLGQRDRAVPLESFSGIQMTVFVEVVVDRGMKGGELLEGLEVPEPGHRPFPSSERLMGVLGSIV